MRTTSEMCKHNLRSASVHITASTIVLAAVICLTPPGCMPAAGPNTVIPGSNNNTSVTGELASSFYTINGPRCMEDLAFDYDGYLLGAQGGHIWRTPLNGSSSIVIANAGGSGPMITGIMVLPNRDILYCDAQSGTLFRASSTGTKRAVLSGLSYPNGMEMDPNGLVYIAENQGNCVRRVNPDTGDSIKLASGVPSPDGVTFNPSYTTLYISSATMSGSSSSGRISAVDIGANGEPGTLRTFATGLPAHLNAMAVDVNGNIYVAAVQAGQIWRVSPDGQTKTAVIKSGGMLATVQWGSGVGGWDTKTLYISDRAETDVIYALNVGIEGKARLYP